MTLDINTTKLYKYFAIVVSKTYSDSVVAICEIEYHGVPEYDPDAHGTDVIARSVPNVPNTDWLRCTTMVKTTRPCHRPSPISPGTV